MIAEEPRVDSAKVTELARSIETELARLIVGQQALVRDTVISLIAGGHGLLEGVPGLGKTVLGRSLRPALSMSTGLPRQIGRGPGLTPVPGKSRIPAYALQKK